jgi:alpha-1,3/alpha-1,6-mannosyltransferase
VNSAYTKSIFEKHISSKIPVDILYPTIPDQTFPSSLSNDNETSINFLSINRFERKKDLVLALHSFAYLRKLLNSNSNSIHLYIIGGYDERLRENVEYFNELQKLANELNLNSSLITFIRSFSDEQKREYLSKSHCILYTPRFEHFGIVPLEAMQAGKPVIATATGGPLETIINGKTGYLCDEPLIETFGKRMKEFVDNKKLSKEMGDEGKRHVNEKFSFKPFAKKLNEHINELLKKSPENRKSFFYFLTFVFCLILSLLIRWLFF